MPDNRTLSKLPLIFCFFLDLPEDRIDCSVSNPNDCVECPSLGRFWVGGDLTSPDGATGHIIILMEWILVLFTGVSGAVTNSLIIIIISRQKGKRAFDTFLLALACFDLIGSVTAVIGSSASIVMLESWDQCQAILYFVFIGSFSCYFARSGSSLLTMIITLERYLVIAFPIRFSNWFTQRKTRLICLILSLFAAFLALPRFASFAVVENQVGRNISSLQHLDYILLPTAQEQFWYGTLGAIISVSLLDFWAPLPILLILNVLIFIEIRKFTKRRKEMNVSQSKDINAAKMFIPVVVVLFVCNLLGYLHWYFVAFEKRAYREVFLGLFLSVSVNSFANFFLYMKSETFRNGFKSMCCGWSWASYCKGLEAEKTTSHGRRTVDFDPYY